MARDNYSFKKHQKELDRKKKAEAKKQKKLEKKAIGVMPESGQVRLNDIVEQPPSSHTALE